jgi:hypothetical protein
LIAGSSTGRGAPVTCEASIDTPVTPPSMKWLDNRKPLMPIAAEKIPAAIRMLFRSSRRKRTFATSSVPEVPAAGEHHRETTLVGGSDHVLIAD